MYVLSVLMAIFCLLGGCDGAAAQTGNGSNSVPPGITAAVVVVNTQGSAQIDVTFASAGQPITGVQFDIQYQDPVTGLAASLGIAASSTAKSIWTSNPQPTQERVLIMGLNQSPIGDGVIATLSAALAVGAPPGLYPLAISNAVATTSDGMAVSISTSAGGVIMPGSGVAAPAIAAVVNAASYQPGSSVAPGEIVVISGNSLGPWALNTLQVTSAGTVATSLAGTRVLFDGISAPLLYTTSTQVAAVVPYELDGLTQSSLQVEYQGIRSAPLGVGVDGSSPGIFTLDQSGNGQGAIVNQDGTLNGPDHPAPKGSVVAIYGTGEGQTAPAGVDGAIADPLNPRQPLLTVMALIGGQSAEVVYAGSSGSQISGLLQANVRVPASAPSGSTAVTLTVGGNSSQPGVTMVVQ